MPLEVISNKETRQSRHQILIVDDHPIFRIGLRRLIESEPDLGVCAEAEDEDQALRMLEIHKPDLVTVDITLKRSNGLDLVKALHEKFADLPVVVVSMHEEEVYGERALRAGARGYIMKDRPADEIIGAFRRALNGEVAVSGELSSALIERLVGRRASPTPTLSQLSDRELQVFDLIGRGSTTREIAEKLEISIKTVETHLLRIRQKLGFKGSKSLHRAAYTWVSEGQLA